jgi:lipopolysaccharide export LptBFGC system permease protein LptF
MGTINRHYFFQLCYATFICTTALLGILLYGNLVKHSEYLLEALAISPFTFFRISSLLIPYALSFALPFGFNLALLFCYGQWSSSNQILALRSLGQSIFSWGLPCLLISFIVAAFSLMTFLEWGPICRAQFDFRKSSLIWSNLDSILQKEKGIQFYLDENSPLETLKSIETLTNKPVRKVSITIGSVQADTWHNLRILLLNNKDEILRIINSKSAKVQRSLNKSQILLFLKGVDLESFVEEERQNLFISFDEWSKPLCFDLGKLNDQKNLKKMTISELWLLSKLKNERGTEATTLIFKRIVLGSSSLFLSFILLPLSINQGRRESMSNLTIGVFLSLTYYAIVIIFEELALSYALPYILFSPIIGAIIIGSYLIYKFDCTRS